MPIIGPIPGLKEAIKQEEFGRLVAFLDMPERVGGVEVVPLTPRLALQLHAVGSPFFCGGETLTTGAVGVFLWHMSTNKRKPRPWWLTQARWNRVNYNRFVRLLAPLNTFTLAGEIVKFIEETGADSPASKSGDDDSPSYASWVSGVVDAVASRYGWSEDTILDIPFRRIWQYYRRWTYRESEGRATFINMLSDGVRLAWLDADIAAKKAKQETKPPNE